MLVNRLPLPSNVPVRFVGHWFNGSARFVLWSNTQNPFAVPLVADSVNPPLPLTWILVRRGDNGGTMTLPTLIAPVAVVAVVPLSAMKVNGNAVAFVECN